MRIKKLLLYSFFFIVHPSFCFSQTIYTVVGNGVAGYSGDGGPATAAEIRNPDEAAPDDSGNIYIADYGNNVIRKVNALTGIINTIAGNGSGGYSGDGGPATAAELNYVLDVTLDSIGNFYISDGSNSVIRKVIKSTGIITTIAGNGVRGFSGDGGQATLAELFSPSGIFIDNLHNNLYIADYQNDRIRKVDLVSGIITTVAGNGYRSYLSGGFSGDGGPATSAELYFPIIAVTDLSGNIFVADSHNNRIRKVDYNSGIITTVAGNGDGGYDGDGGSAILAEMNDPYDVKLDTLNNIWIADVKNNCIREVSNPSGIINTTVGNGRAGFSGDGGPPLLAELNVPSSISFDKNGNYYIADYGNNRIREVKPCPPLAPVKNTLSSDTLICSGTSTVLSASGEGYISWYSSGTGGNYLSTGGNFTTGIIYSDTIFYVQDSLSCGVSPRTAISIKVIPTPIGKISGEFSICLGQTDSLIASGGNSYLWNTGDTGTVISISPRLTSPYTVIIENDGCSDTVTATVVVDTPMVTACCWDTSIAYGQTIQLSGFKGVKYLWSPSNVECDTCPSITISPSQTTTYTLTIIENTGCITSQVFTIDVSCGEVFIPTIFTPDNISGHNSILYVRGPCISQMDFCVFDRWGNKVFESLNPNQGWDGSYKGQPMTEGTFVWYLKSTLLDGTSIAKKGNVTLVR